jgi:hypothetical protein
VKIYTTYFAKLKKLPPDIIVVSIANKDPSPSFSSNKYQKLVPPWYIVKAYKETGDKEQYIKDYKRLVLDHLDTHEVVSNLKNRAGYGDVALVCYEKSGDFCHRHLVAEWLRNAGYYVEEWKEGSTQ